MPTTNKQDLVAEIKAKFAASDAVIMVDYRGLTNKEIETLRVALRGVDASMKVYKNSLTEIAMRELALPAMDEILAGPTAFVFANGEANVSAKEIANFAKIHKELELKGGLIDSQVVGSDAIKAIAALPSRDELLSKLLGTMKNPMANFARVIDAIGKQKAEEQAA